MTQNIASPVAEYLDTLDVSLTIRKRILEIEKFYTQLLPGKMPSHVFLSEFIDNEGQRVFENVSFFFEKFWCEAHNFQFQDNFDLFAVAPVYGLILDRSDYEVGQATVKSRFSVNFRFVANNFGLLKASGANCEALWQIVQDFILPLTLDVE